MRIIGAWTSLCIFLLSGVLPLEAQVYSGHALAMYGDIKYGPDFTHFDYANPQAPKGGRVRLAAIGTFDDLNGYILKGVSAAGLGRIYNSLMSNSSDEAFTEYGELAATVETPEDRSWVAFTLREEARWHDGRPVTPEDVIFSFEILTEKGHPFFRSYYADVEKVEKTAERTVKFTFGGGTNRELPLIMGQLTIFPKHYWEGRAFDETTLEIPLGSGAYRIEAVDPGRSITYQRVDDYWGQDLPVAKGRHNFDVIHYDYYRDATVAVEALKAGEYDFRRENNSKDWATAYQVPAVEEGRLVQELVDNEIGTGMQGFWFNTRRAKFADSKVRQALAYAFDFEWTNANLFYGQYTRTKSYFSNSELASRGLPEGLELEILEKFKGRVPDEVFTQEYEPPANDGSGQSRQNLRTGRKLLAEAGWEVVDGQLVNGAGETMEIEFLLVSAGFERIVGPIIQNLERLGITATMRTVDAAQYQNRLQEFDFDMIVSSRGQSQSPGNEQREFWTSEAAKTPGSRNHAGIEDAAVDELVELLIGAPDRANLIAATRALDRVLLWGHYVIPNWHMRSFRLVYWNKFGRPVIQPKYALGFPDFWWIDTDKQAQLEKGE
ncbi:MAG: ABC transporter substrate-binding protein [Candidatus Latescibacteria bacterium]|nr:ABC transporter substrate-binding protein [Candidatus Latescibacterota bacterium]